MVMVVKSVGALPGGFSSSSLAFLSFIICENFLAPCFLSLGVGVLEDPIVNASFQWYEYRDDIIFGVMKGNAISQMTRLLVDEAPEDLLDLFLNAVTNLITTKMTDLNAAMSFLTSAPEAERNDASATGFTVMDLVGQTNGHGRLGLGVGLDEVVRAVLDRCSAKTRNKLKKHPSTYTKTNSNTNTSSGLNTNTTMCNNVIRLCLACAQVTPNKGSSCPSYDDAKRNGATYEDMYDKAWLIEHTKENPEKFRNQVTLTFCTNCEHKKTPGFKPNIKKVAKSAIPF
ncbi:hypothetical protein VTN96DRAFT_6516 [Rasamsonia emersonii]